MVSGDTGKGPRPGGEGRELGSAGPGSRRSELSRSTEPPTLCRVSSFTPDLTRTCPWCADATIIGLSEEGMIRALTRHLEQCPGQQEQEQV